jgi:cardiolipin synthase (CMP-forming)
MTIPNILTILRICVVPFFIAASVTEHFTLAFVLFISAAATDILDGMIARRFNQRSRIGALLDPMADKMMMVSGYLFFTFSNKPWLRVPGWLTYIVFLRDFLIIVFAYFLYTRMNVKHFPPSIAGKVSTVLQAAALGTTIGVNAFVPSLLWLAQLLFRMALVATLYSGWDYLRRRQRLLVDGLAASAP